jgi:DNA-binding PadR family transcriptional regulator
MKPAKETTGMPALSARDWHVLLALSGEDLHGYAIMKAIEKDSGGRVSAEIGSMYRTLGRMMTAGLLAEVAAPVDAPAETRGRTRRYYAVTDQGRAAFRQEARRLRDALDLAKERQLMPTAPK